MFGEFLKFYADLFNVPYMAGYGAFNTFFNTNIQVGDLTCNLSQYIAIILSIISMVAILVLCCALIKKIYNICAHVIG